MTDSRRNFSTIRGIGFIAVFFLFLAIIPVLFRDRHFNFKSQNSSSSSYPTDIPIDFPLKVFRNSISDVARSNNKVTLKTLLGTGDSLTLVNFWATWCPPCLEELPSLESLHRQLLQRSKSGNFPMISLITISVDDRLEDITKLERTLDFKPTFTVLYDKDGELARSLGTTKFPETYLINKSGKILYKWLGPQNWLSEDVLRQLKLHSEQMPASGTMER